MAATDVAAQRTTSIPRDFNVATYFVDRNVDEGRADNVGPMSTRAFVSVVWMTITTVAEILAERGVKLYIHPSHNVRGDTTAHERLNSALAEYKRRIAGV